MAKKTAKKDLNKAQAIRDYAAANRAAGPTEIAKALSEKHGVPFAVAQVSNTLTNAKKKSGKAKAKPTGVGNGNNVVEVITLARKFVKAAGGTAAAAEILLALGGDEVGNG
jgi:hypothetical protein